MQSGKPLCTNPLYGYVKDPNDKLKWVIDEEAAKSSAFEYLTNASAKSVFPASTKNGIAANYDYAVIFRD